MKIPPFITRILSPLALGALLLTPVASKAQPATPNNPGDTQQERRPAGVPATYRLTPFGWISPSCLIAVEKGQTFNAARQAREASGRRCGAQRFDRTGAPIGQNASTSQLKSLDRYETFASVDIPRDYDRVAANSRLVVPEEPRLKPRTTIFLDTGIHDVDDITGTLFHTSVVYNLDSEHPGWWATIWVDAWRGKDTYYLKPVKISSGEEIQSTIDATQSGGQTTITASITNTSSGDTIITGVYGPQPLNANSILNLGFDPLLPSNKCSALPLGGEISYPLLNTYVARGGGPLNDISGKIAARPQRPDALCEIELTLNDAEKARVTRQ